jgi:hypothetical protein
MNLSSETVSYVTQAAVDYLAMFNPVPSWGLKWSPINNLQDVLL